MVSSSIGRLKFVFFSPSLDNFLFKLCYRWTTLLLVAFSFIVTCRLLFGNSFACISKDSKKSVPCSNYEDMKCYADGTYTDPAELFVDKYVLLVDNDISSSAQELRRHQTYYQWVNLLFLAQALGFYLPHLLWQSYERGYMFKLTTGVQNSFGNEEKRSSELCYLARYILATQRKHKMYALVYILCEVSNFLIAVAQTTWLIGFFDVTGVPELLPLELETWKDFENFYFPSAGTCEIEYSSEKCLYLCEMPLNSLYMIMYLFLHTWFIILAILAGLVLIYRIVLLSSSFRMFVMRNTSFVEKSVVKSLCHRMAYSDWFFLTRLQKNLTDHEFAQMLDKMTILSQIKGEQQYKTKRLTFADETFPDIDISDKICPQGGVI